MMPWKKNVFAISDTTMINCFQKNAFSVPLPVQPVLAQQKMIALIVIRPGFKLIILTNNMFSVKHALKQMIDKPAVLVIQRNLECWMEKNASA